MTDSLGDGVEHTDTRVTDRQRLGEVEKQLRIILESRDLPLSFDAWLGLQEAHITVQRCCESLGVETAPSDGEAVAAAAAFETAAKRSDSA